MRIQGPVALFVVAPLFALAQSDSDSQNLTITLYPSDAEDSCEEGGSGGITLTTNTIPRHHTCIDVEAIFGGDDRVGFLNDTLSEDMYGPEDDTSEMDPPGIHWYISSDDGPSAYEPSKNWTNIWFKQMNDTDDGQGEGKVGRWVVMTFENIECQRYNADFPWYTASCQTSENGTCESSPYSIKGIRINRLGEFDDYESCHTWAELDAAPGLVPHASAALVVALLAALLM